MSEQARGPRIREHRIPGGRAWGAALGLALGASLGGCGVGVGVGQQWQNVSMKPHREYGRLTEGEATTRMTTLSFHDPWGLLVAGIATHNNAVNSQDDAVRQALDDGAVAGTEVRYSYDIVPPRPGLMTTVKVAWGGSDLSGTGPLLPDNLPGPVKAPIEAFEFDFTTGLLATSLAEEITVGLTLSALYQTWEGGRLDPEVSRVVMPLGLALGRDLFPGVHLSVYGRFDVTGPLITAWLYDHWADYSYGAHLSVALADWLNLQFDAQRAQLALDYGDGEGRLWVVGGELVLVWPLDD